MTGFEVVARHHRSQHHFVDLSRLHPGEGLIVAIAIPHALNGLIEIVGAPIWIDINEFYREVSVLRIGRYVQRQLYRSAYFNPLLKGFTRVYEDIGSGFILTLIKRPCRNSVSCATNVATI